MYISLENLSRQFLDNPKVGRVSFLRPKDIRQVCGISESTLLRDRKLGLIEPLSPGIIPPEFHVSDIHGYLIRKGKIQVAPDLDIDDIE